MSPLRRAALLIGGCIILGIGVALILTADLGSDGFSTLVNGFRLATGVPFFVANLVISGSFLLIAAARRVIPGIGTIAQIVIVGGVASIGLDALPSPGSLGGQPALLALSLPVIGVGVACYLGSHLGAGPAEAAGLAWRSADPVRVELQRRAGVRGKSSAGCSGRPSGRHDRRHPHPRAAGLTDESAAPFDVHQN